MKSVFPRHSYFAILGSTLAALSLPGAPSAPEQPVRRERTIRSETPLKVEEQISIFYTQLTLGDPEIKLEFAALTKDDGGRPLRGFDPVVVEWFPLDSSWGGPGDLEVTGTYLVIQSIGDAGGHGMTIDFNIVAVFEAKQKRTGARKGGKDSDVIHLKFLGFRKIVLDPIK